MILVKLYYVYKHQRLIPARFYAAGPSPDVEIADMNRIQNIFQNSPNVIGQTQRHCRRFVQQRIMHPCPVFMNCCQY
jgi:hypothetical protein